MIPPPRADTDQFGLPTSWTLLGETPKQTAQRQAQAREMVCAMFATAVRHLGAKEARRLWKEVARGKDGRPKKSSNPERDQLLLYLFDVGITQAGQDAERLPACIDAWLQRKEQEDLHKDYKLPSAGNIEKQLRRLLKKREENAAEMSELTMRIWGTAEPPPSMLTRGGGQKPSQD